jgi:hypothetical protein
MARDIKNWNYYGRWHSSLFKFLFYNPIFVINIHKSILISDADFLAWCILKRGLIFLIRWEASTFTWDSAHFHLRIHSTHLQWDEISRELGKCCNLCWVVGVGPLRGEIWSHSPYTQSWYAKHSILSLRISRETYRIIS